MNQNGIRRQVAVEVPTTAEGKSYTLELDGDEVKIVAPLSLRTHGIRLEALERAVSELRTMAGKL